MPYRYLIVATWSSRGSLFVVLVLFFVVAVVNDNDDFKISTVYDDHDTDTRELTVETNGHTSSYNDFLASSPSIRDSIKSTMSHAICTVSQEQ
jgi:hypothetical protein